MGRGIRVFDVRLGRDTLRVLSVPLTTPEAEGLSRAERAVAALALEGHSNQAIAEMRRASPRTIANQLASAYRKLGISGRAELAVAIGRRR